MLAALVPFLRTPQCDSLRQIECAGVCYLDCNTTGVWKLQEMVTEVLHSINVDSHIRRPIETLDKGSGSIVHTHLCNDLGDTNKTTSLDIVWVLN